MDSLFCSRRPELEFQSDGTGKRFASRFSFMARRGPGTRYCAGGPMGHTWPWQPIRWVAGDHRWTGPGSLFALRDVAPASERLAFLGTALRLYN